ncbi:MAG: polymer-forming cytoskeletal protein [Desulfobacterales bacterium]|nr:polymer-forming cytoskeletal protein [Desulfobacterales bacterium]
MQKDKTADSTSLVSKNVRIEGEIEGPENLHVEGYIKGAIALSGDIFIGNTGIVEANLEAKNVVIQGEVNGNVTALQQLEIHPSGKLIGDCTAKSIDIKEGAVFDGRSIMMKKKAASAAIQTKTNDSSGKQHPIK